MVPLLIMATSLVSKINTSVALLKGWVNSFLAFMGQLYLGFYTCSSSLSTLQRVRLSAGLSVPHRLSLELLRIRLLDFWHDPASPSGIVYPKFSLLHKSEGSSPAGIPRDADVQNISRSC